MGDLLTVQEIVDVTLVVRVKVDVNETVDVREDL